VGKHGDAVHGLESELFGELEGWRVVLVRGTDGLPASSGHPVSERVKTGGRVAPATATFDRVDADVPERLGHIARGADSNDVLSQHPNRDRFRSCCVHTNVVGKVLKQALVRWRRDDDAWLGPFAAAIRASRGMDYDLGDSPARKRLANLVESVHLHD